LLGSYFQESQNYNAQAKPITHNTADTQMLIYEINCLYIASTDNGRKLKLNLKKKRERQENAER
jgi:hypothetical protein